MLALSARAAMAAGASPTTRWAGASKAAAKLAMLYYFPSIPNPPTFTTPTPDASLPPNDGLRPPTSPTMLRRTLSRSTGRRVFSHPAARTAGFVGLVASGAGLTTVSLVVVVLGWLRLALVGPV